MTLRQTKGPTLEEAMLELEETRELEQAMKDKELIEEVMHLRLINNNKEIVRDILDYRAADGLDLSEARDTYMLDDTDFYDKAA